MTSYGDWEGRNGRATNRDLCTCHVWTAPLVKGFVEALRTSWARSCLRSVDAEWMALLALIIGLHGPSPPSPYRARTGADTCTGFQAYPRVHITSSAAHHQELAQITVAHLGDAL